jgi:hypothetical protein
VIERNCHEFLREWLAEVFVESRQCFRIPMPIAAKNADKV